MTNQGDAPATLHTTQQRLGAVAIANTIQIVVGYPLDTMKTWYQIDTRFVFTPKRLYSGIMPPIIIGSGVAGICFEMFERGIQIMPDYLAAMATGVCATSFTAIADPMKIHRQVGGCGGMWGIDCASGAGSRYLNALPNILPRYGRFFTHCLCREIPFCGIYFTTQHRLRRDSKINPGIIGAISSVFAWTLSYPMDVMKTHNITRTVKSFGAGDTNVPVFRWSGIRYDRGLPLSIVRVGICGGIFMYVYDMMI